ncbi:DUF6412 domain-containing protein [Actinomadura macrotermitis]|uniref:Uncharacterized protein n=1 Tax=Actinomadura macrotermitis TaxID=2585200 RepID=A0A7K0C3Y2_9ACTN|nr:DUF6412 domain-containing protein [Actinomadura macrotermitis]MQY08145.1 hypothetical protein [Actinomadura macrotermitis]
MPLIFATLIGLLSGDHVVLTLAALTVAGLLVLAAAHAVARREPPAVLARLRTTLRERTLRTAFLPQRDPDAAGRPRPRAPGVKISAV